MQRHGWTLLFHDCLVEQLDRLPLPVMCRLIVPTGTPW